MSERKIIKFQILRAIAIIMVVLIHTVSVEKNLYIRQMFNFAVPLFIFLSGFFYNEKKFNESGIKYLLSKLQTILIPYFFWSLLVLSLFLVLNKINPNDLFLKLATGGALGPYYYIIVLTQLILFSPIMAVLNTKLIGKIVLFALTPITLATLYILRINFIINFNNLYYALPFTVWFIFYYTGYLTKKNDIIIKLSSKLEKNRLIFLILFIVSFGFTILESYIINIKLFDTTFAASQVKFTSFIMSFMIIFYLILFEFKDNPLNRLLVKIGDISFGIFLIHIIVIIAFRYIFNIFSLEIESSIFWFLISLVFSIIIIYTTKKTIRSKYVKIVLGF